MKKNQRLVHKDNEILKKSIKEIMGIIIDLDDDLKEGSYNKVQSKIGSIFQTHIEYFKSNFELRNSKEFGINLEIVGLHAPFLFPYSIYSNNFRKHLIKKLEKYLEQRFDYESFCKFLSLEIAKTIDTKRGGYNIRTLELLRFYYQNFHYVLDNSVDRFLPFLNNYTTKYVNISSKNIIKKFNLIQKYTRLRFIPNDGQINIPAVFIDYNNGNVNLNNLYSKELGLIYDTNYEKIFFIGFLSNHQIKDFQSNLVRSITFFENLDLYHSRKRCPELRNGVGDIFKLYCDYKENDFTNMAIDFNTNFLYKSKNTVNTNLDYEILAHAFNTRKIPNNFEIYPLLKEFISYRIKLVTIYTTTRYFIHIYDPGNKNLDRYWKLLDLLLKNTFANGFVIHYRTGMLLSTNAFKEDFENVKQEFVEFIWSFKLECNIYENLNYIPFSFYHLPNSQYYCNETNHWEFPVFEDKQVTEYFDHLAVNYRQEIKRLDDDSFKIRLNQTLERLTREIDEIKKQQKKV